MITSNTQFSAVSGALSDLKGERISIQDIIDTVLQINNMKSKTLAKMKSNACYNPSEVGVVPLKSLYVDMTYQRIIRLQKLINKLRKLEGYDMYSAGVVDVAIDHITHGITRDSLAERISSAHDMRLICIARGKQSFYRRRIKPFALRGVFDQAHQPRIRRRQ